VPAILQTISLLLPILAPGILLIAVLKLGLAGFLDTPVDGGRLLGGRPLLGATKTWRGVVIYTGGAVLVGAVLGGVSDAADVFHDRAGWFVGLLVGLGYNAGEFANSFVKRRLGVGSSTLGRWRTLQRVVDLGDGILVVFVVYLALGVPLPLAAAAGVAGFAVHALTDVVMHALRLKSRRA
jgi:CDP-diglyceride synthetase